ncbi:hypothetical protein ACFFRR_011824 [Megaselia abdita]
MSRKITELKENAGLCFHCYKPIHSTNTRCTENGIVSCTNCFRVNVFTKKCSCNFPNRPPPLHVLRFCGDSADPDWYVDLQIHDKVVPALLNPSIKRGRVNLEFATWWQSVVLDSVYRDADTIVIETVRKGQSFEIPCDVFESQEEHLQLGREFMLAVGYSFTLEGMTIHSKSSPVLSSPFETQYVYNIDSHGQDLREFLNTRKFFLKKGRINKLSLPCSNGSKLRSIVVKRLNNESRRVIRK